jgi:hypothetical protein
VRLISSPVLNELRFLLMKALATSCDHELARWLLSLFADRTVMGRVEVQQVFLALGNDDARALCFGTCMKEPLNMDMIERTAKFVCTGYDGKKLWRGQQVVVGRTGCTTRRA